MITLFIFFPNWHAYMQMGLITKEGRHNMRHYIWKHYKTVLSSVSSKQVLEISENVTPFSLNSHYIN